METHTVFDKYYRRYDEWYMIHWNIRKSENLCIRILAPHGRILDIGVGTGALLEGLEGLIVGVDPAENPLRIASERGVLPINAYGEELPFIDEYFDTVLMSVTICFLPDPLKVLREAYRVLRRHGSLFTCFIPLESRWAQHYLYRKYSGRSIFYSYARFYSLQEVHYMLSITGFRVREYCSTPWGSPLEPEYVVYPVKALIEDSGFICVRSEKE